MSMQDELVKLGKEIESAKNQIAQLEGRQTEVLNRLKKDFRCKNLTDAEKLLDKMSTDLEKMDAEGITFAVIHMVSPTPSGVIDTNTWLIQHRQERFIKFGTLHPLFKNCDEEIKRLKGILEYTHYM